MEDCITPLFGLIVHEVIELRGCRNLQKKYCTFKCYLERCHPPLKGLLALWKTYHILSKKYMYIYMENVMHPLKKECCAHLSALLQSNGAL